MTPDDSALPLIVAPPLSPAASFDADVADLHEVEWLASGTIVRKD
ncbi:MAG: hypothetical protein ACT6XY_12710 [Phreatobacter sp.]